MMLERVDKLLVSRGVVATRTQAQRLIQAGAVKGQVQGQWHALDKPAQKIPKNTEFDITEIAELKYVSRAGLKLEAALSHIVATGKQACVELLTATASRVLDVGQSTGGFSDCLLQLGVGHIVGVDVGHNQLAPALRGKANLSCVEGINARTLSPEFLDQYCPGGFDALVMDVSFISQTLLLQAIRALLKPEGIILALVKPQFEVGREGLSKNGIVKDSALFEQVEQKIKAAYQAHELKVLDYFQSALPGSDGNQEFFVLACK